MIRCPACGGNNSKPGYCALCGCYLSPLLEEPDIVTLDYSVTEDRFSNKYITILNERFPTFQDIQRYNVYQHLMALETEESEHVLNDIANANRYEIANARRNKNGT